MIAKERTIGIVTGSVLLLTVAGAVFLPQPYSYYAFISFVTCYTAGVACFFSSKSTKPRSELLKNVVVAATIVGAIGAMCCGEPSHTDNELTSPFPSHEGHAADGYDPTFEQRAAMGVRWFLVILGGGLFGVQVTFLLGIKERQANKSNNT